MASQLPDDLTAKGLFTAGANHGDLVDWRANRAEQLFRNSLVLEIIQAMQGKKGQGIEVLQSAATPQAKAAYAAGRVAADLALDGSRVPYWLLNHPLAVTNVLAQTASEAAGLTPSYQNELQQAGTAAPRSQGEMIKRHARRYGFSHSELDPARSGVIPARLAGAVIPGIATTALVAASGTHDPLNIAQGGRSAGYQAVLQKEGGDPRETAFAPAELLLRYVAGRSGRLLDWEEFTQERPDVSREDYEAARRHQFDRGLGGLGLFKGTGRNLNGEPEVTFMGFQVPLSGAASAAGAMLGGVAGANVAERISQKSRERLKDNVRQTLADGGADRLRRQRGYRMVGGGALGAAAGAAAANLTSRAVNDLVIQPSLYPERVQADQAWQMEQQRRAAVQQQVQSLQSQQQP